MVFFQSEVPDGFDFLLAEAFSEEELQHLKSMPGIWDACEGVRSLGSKLKVCQISGSSVIFSSPVKAEFQQAPHFIREKFEALEKEHIENYGKLLKSKLTPEAGSTPGSGTHVLLLMAKRQTHQLPPCHPLRAKPNFEKSTPSKWSAKLLTPRM